VSLSVVDASVLTAFYVADDVRRTIVVARLAAGDALFAPAHLDAEVVSALRGLEKRVPALHTAVPGALRHLAHIPIRRMPLAPLLERMWELHTNVTAYDAAYVALAEQLGASVVTCDGKLATASGPRCEIEDRGTSATCAVAGAFIGPWTGSISGRVPWHARRERHRRAPSGQRHGSPVHAVPYFLLEAALGAGRAPSPRPVWSDGAEPV